MALLQSLARLYGAIQCLYILSPFCPTISAGVIQTNQNYYYVGEVITLHCFANTKFVDLRFSYGNDFEVPTEYVTVINDTYARMDRPAMAEDYAKTTYACWSNFETAEDVDTQTVETEYRLQKVTNLTCIYDNMQDAVCSWNLAAQYKNNYFIKAATDWRATPEESWQNCTTSTKTSCNIINYTQPVLYVRVNVTNIRRRDSVTTEFPVIIMKKDVKMSPVSNLQAANLNSTCIFLSWNLTHSYVRYYINYSRNDAHHISYDQSNACYHGFYNTSEKNITVCSLCPSRNYTFVVMTKPDEFGIFSDPALVSLQTQEDVPASGPQVTMGGYSREPCSSRDQDVWIYFQPVPEEDRNGNIINYIVAVVDEEKHTKDYIFNNSENSFAFSITVPCNQGFNASLYANTLVGSSPPSIVSVPAVTKVPIMETIDFAIQKNAGESLTALWNPPEDSRVNTVFVYYCKSLLKPSKHCKTPMQHVVASASAGKQMVNSSDADIFGISLVSDDNVATEIHFPDCIFTPGQDRRSVKTPEKPDTKTLSKTTVRVKLEYKNCDNNFMTYGYQISVCQAEDTSKCFIQNVNSGRTFAVNVTNLKADTKYSFSFRANTSSGLSEWSEKTYHSLPTLRNSESLSTADRAAIISIVSVTLLIMGSTLACTVRKRFTKTEMVLKFARYPKPAKHFSGSAEKTDKAIRNNNSMDRYTKRLNGTNSSKRELDKNDDCMGNGDSTPSQDVKKMGGVGSETLPPNYSFISPVDAETPRYTNFCVASVFQTNTCIIDANHQPLLTSNVKSVSHAWDPLYKNQSKSSQLAASLSPFDKEMAQYFSMTSGDSSSEVKIDPYILADVHRVTDVICTAESESNWEENYVLNLSPVPRSPDIGDEHYPAFLLSAEKPSEEGDDAVGHTEKYNCTLNSQPALYVNTAHCGSAHPATKHFYHTDGCILHSAQTDTDSGTCSCLNKDTHQEDADDKCSNLSAANETTISDTLKSGQAKFCPNKEASLSNNVHEVFHPEYLPFEKHVF